MIDFDGQRHTTKLCGVTAPEQLSVTIYDILKCIVMNEELPDKGSYMIRTLSVTIWKIDFALKLRLIRNDKFEIHLKNRFLTPYGIIVSS